MTAVPVELDRLFEAVDERTRTILAHRLSRPARHGRGWLMRRMLLTADLVGLGIAFAVPQLIFESGNAGLAEVLAEAALFAVALPVWVVAAKLIGLYARDEQRADHSTADDFTGVFELVTVGTWLALLVAYLAKFPNPQISKLAVFWGIAVVAVPLLRSMARAHCRRSIDYLQNALIIGAGDVGRQIARKILTHPEYGVNLVGFVDMHTVPDAPDSCADHVRLLGDIDDVPMLIDLFDVERVILAFSGHSVDEAVQLMRTLNGLQIQVDVVPRLYEVISPAARIHSVEGLPLVGLRPATLSNSEKILKRGLDVVGAFLGIVLLAPLFALVAVAIKLDSAGPVLFRQVRMGANDRPFRIVKFRTMTADADGRKRAVAHLNKHAQNGGDARMFKIEDDPRVTRLGRGLRRYSIDELPQLWNVLRGEMSLVGPRPLILDEHAHVADWAGRRLDLRPGITGLWQVLGRDDIPFAEMVKLDYLYITNWSLGGDIGLLMRTLPAVARRGVKARRIPASEDTPNNAVGGESSCAS